MQSLTFRIHETAKAVAGQALDGDSYEAKEAVPSIELSTNAILAQMRNRPGVSNTNTGQPYAEARDRWQGNYERSGTNATARLNQSKLPH